LTDINEVAENIYMIDDQLCSIQKWGSVYLLNEERKALIDSGPASSSRVVLDGIKRIGINPQNIDYIIVTHIHLDHAGGAWLLLEDMPQAQVLVHHKGAKHLVNPAKLISSMAGVSGEEIAKEYGEILPIQSHRVKGVYEGDTLRLSGRQILKFIDAPGHAPHELCIYESRNGGVFIGDVLGAYLSDYEILLPYHPPPNFNFELSASTIKRLMQLNATKLYFAHFGTSSKVQENLQEALDKLQVWGDMLARAIGEGTLDSTRERIIAQACAELDSVHKSKDLFEFLTKYYLPICAGGHIKYHQEQYNT